MLKLQFSAIAALVLTTSLAAVGCGGAEGSGEGAESAKGEGHPLVGSVVPNFAAQSLNGKGRASVKPNDGKVLIVDFWATWCEPCRKSFPRLQELYTKYKSSGMEIVAVSEDDENSEIKGFGDSFGTKFPLVWDNGKTIASKWQPKSMPSTFVVDRKGVVRFVHMGYHDGEEAEIEKEVKSLL
jgi:cytochrome c biogenesis protein CcmG/thiol:disulfide interchange protein DsbE